MSHTDFAKETLPANIEQEMKRSYLDYAMSVIVGRALPDIRDGLKPVHRRILYAMSELYNEWNKAYKKSARIVGDVIGKYHPHGDTAVYDTIVRMAQNFSMRYMLIDGQGNFGSVDGDSPAAMRYTEIRLAKISHELLSDLDKETVDFGPNYDETKTQPLVLPAKIPNFLINGSTGIAVGMATNVPPHNLIETINACLALIENSNISILELMHHLPGPDFPTAGIINGRSGIKQAYETGKGCIQVRARAKIEHQINGRESIVVHELPYQVNKSKLLEKISELVKNKQIEGLSAIRDESDQSGMRLVVEIKRGEQAEVILNNLFKQTQMQSVFGINMVALRKNQPKLFNLKEALEEFIRHRQEVVTRKTLYEFRKAKKRVHIIEGLAIALANINPIIQLIKSTKNLTKVKEELMANTWNSTSISKEILERSNMNVSKLDNLNSDMNDLNLNLNHKRNKMEQGYQLSFSQVHAILELRLNQLTGLEQEKINKEYTDVIDKINKLLEILNDPDRLMMAIKEELIDIKNRYGDKRKTEILKQSVDFSIEDLIPEEDVVVTISHAGYAKSHPVSDYSAQKRGGKGRIATKNKEEDFVGRMFIANSHDTILCFSNIGKVYWLRVFQLSQAGRQARGKPLINLLPLIEKERVTAVMPIKNYEEGKSVIMATAHGTIKKCNPMDFSNPRSSGIIAIRLEKKDHLIGAALTDDSQDILLISNAGKALRFSEADIRIMGRTAKGVKGIQLENNQKVISLMVVNNQSNRVLGNKTILTSTMNGYGKRTLISDFPKRKRGGKGIIAIKASKRNGEIVSALNVEDNDEVMLITDSGILIRTWVSEISIQGRNTQGVKLISLKGKERLVTVSGVADTKENGNIIDGESFH